MAICCRRKKLKVADAFYETKKIMNSRKLSKATFEGNYSLKAIQPVSLEIANRLSL